MSAGHRVHIRRAECRGQAPRIPLSDVRTAQPRRADRATEHRSTQNTAQALQFAWFKFAFEAARSLPCWQRGVRRSDSVVFDWTLRASRECDHILVQFLSSSCAAKFGSSMLAQWCCQMPHCTLTLAADEHSAREEPQTMQYVSLFSLCMPRSVCWCFVRGLLGTFC